VYIHKKLQESATKKKDINIKEEKTGAEEKISS
jgi:hypothetical protein